jgi:hypothetical protein
VEEPESDCGVHVENILQEELDAGKVQNPKESLMYVLAVSLYMM